jgi:hypothetical protein
MLPLLAEINWPEVIAALGVGGVLTAFVQGFFTRRKEQDDKEKVTFDTLLLAIKERLEKAELKITDLETQLNNSEKEVLKLTVIITEQAGKIKLYESKITEYETRIALYDVTQQLKEAKKE